MTVEMKVSYTQGQVMMTALLADMMDRDLRPSNHATEGYYTKIHNDNMTLSDICFQYKYCTHE